MCWEIRRPASRCLLMKRFVLKQMGADHTWCRACGAVLLVGFRSALSGNTIVNASFQKALYYDHFWIPCAGIVSALRVLGFLGPIRASDCPTRTLDIWSVKRPRFDMPVRQVGKRYSFSRLASEVRHARSSTWQTLQLCKAGIDRRGSTRLEMPVRQAPEPSGIEIRRFETCSRACRLVTFRNRTSLPIWRRIMVPMSRLDANQS
jgi:hypothetical protein